MQTQHIRNKSPLLVNGPLHSRPICFNDNIMSHTPQFSRMKPPVAPRRNSRPQNKTFREFNQTDLSKTFIRRRAHRDQCAKRSYSPSAAKQVTI